MGVFKGPHLTSEKRTSFVPAPGELIYDTELGIYFMGNGIAVGGPPLVVREGLDYSTGGVLGPRDRRSTDYALALFEGAEGKRLRNGPTSQYEGMALRGQGPGAAPIFDFLSLADLRAIGNTNDIVIFTPPGNNTQQNGGLSLGRVPISSLAPAGEKGQVLTSTGKGVGNAPSYQDPQNGFVRIGTYQKTVSNAAFEITSGLDATYDTYLLIGTNIKLTGANTTSFTLFDIYFRSGDLWWVDAGNQKYMTVSGKYVDSIALPGNVGVDSGCTIKMYIFNPGVATLYTTFMIDYVALHIHGVNAAMAASSYSGCTIVKNPVNGIRIKPRAGDIRSGTLTLYGLDKGKPSIGPDTKPGSVIP